MTASLYARAGELLATVRVPHTPHCPDYIMWRGRLFRCLHESPTRDCATYAEERVYVISTGENVCAGE